MKKLALMSLCAVLCFQLTACGNTEQTTSKQDAETVDEDSKDSKDSKDNEDNDKKDDKDEKESSSSIGDDIESGKLLIDGKEYSFPSDIADWTGDGWHISNLYTNTDTFELETNVESNEFEVFNDEKDSEYVTMCAINLGVEPTKIEESVTSYLDVSLTGGKKGLKVELPGGIGRDSGREDVVGAYGEPEAEEDNTLYYFYTNEDDLDIAVALSFDANGVYDVIYSLADSNWGSVANAEECAQFIDDALKTSFYGDYENYVENKFDTEEGALELYEAEYVYYGQGLMYYLGIDYDQVSGEIADGYYALAQDVLAKFKWDKPVVDLPDGATIGSAEVTMYPTDFLDIIVEDADVLAVAENSELSLDEYAQAMLDAITPLVDEISYKDPVTKTYDIDTNDTVISSDDWENMDDILMDLAE